jgi:hypothetical protein
VVGSAIGKFVRHPVGGFAAGLASHAALDVIPHYDYLTVEAGAIDLALGLAFLAALGLRRSGEAGAWAILGATLPDLEVALSRFGVIAESDLLFPTHNGLLPHPHCARAVGLLVQACLTAVSLALLVRGPA